MSIQERICRACEGVGQDKYVDSEFDLFVDEPCYLCGGTGLEKQLSTAGFLLVEGE